MEEGKRGGCRDPILRIVIDVTQNFRHGQSQSHTIFYYYAMLKYITIDHDNCFFTIGLDSYLISHFITLILSSYIMSRKSLFLFCRALPERIFPPEHWRLGQLASWWNTLACTGRHPLCEIVPPIVFHFWSVGSNYRYEIHYTALFFLKLPSAHLQRHISSNHKL